MSTELNLNQPTLPGMENLPATKAESEATKLKKAELLVDKANRKTASQLQALKEYHQPETRKELSYGGYIDKEQRLYESIKVPGYETPEKSNVSYKKLKEKEKAVTVDDWRKDNPRWKKHVADHLAKDMQTIHYNKDLGAWQDNFGEKRKGEEVLKEQQKISKMYKDLGVPEGESTPTGLGNKSMRSDIRTPNQKKKDNYNIKQRLKNARGPSDWEVITKTATSWQDKQDIREIVNKNYKRDPSSIAPEDRKYVDRENIEPVKIFDTTPVKPELPVKTDIDREKDIREIVKKLADDRHKAELEAYDKQHGRGGITEIVREKI